MENSMRGRRRFEVVHGVGADVRPSITRNGMTYYLQQAELYHKIPGTVKAIYTLPGIPAKTRGRS